MKIKEGQRYWYIGSFMRLAYDFWVGHNIGHEDEKEFVKADNFFLTKPAAQSALKKIKKVLREVGR